MNLIDLDSVPVIGRTYPKERVQIFSRTVGEKFSVYGRYGGRRYIVDLEVTPQFNLKTVHYSEVNR